MRYCPQIPDPWKWIARLVLFFSSSSTHIISSTSINRLQDFKKSSTRLRLMVQRTLHIPSFKRLQRTEKSEKCCSSSCKSISHLFWSEFLSFSGESHHFSFLDFGGDFSTFISRIIFLCSSLSGKFLKDSLVSHRGILICLTI